MDEGFFGESGAHGQVRSDSEINVTSQYSTLSKAERLALLTHEGVHIWQRQHGLLDNFRGAWLHIKSLVLRQSPYVVSKDFRGSFWQLNIEQQGAVVGDFVGVTLSPNFPPYTRLNPIMIERLYWEFRGGTIR